MVPSGYEAQVSCVLKGNSRLHYTAFYLSHTHTLSLPPIVVSPEASGVFLLPFIRSQSSNLLSPLGR
jgi:hypothetical protein